MPAREFNARSGAMRGVYREQVTHRFATCHRSQTGEEAELGCFLIASVPPPFGGRTGGGQEGGPKGRTRSGTQRLLEARLQVTPECLSALPVLPATGG